MPGRLFVAQRSADIAAHQAPVGDLNRLQSMAYGKASADAGAREALEGRERGVTIACTTRELYTEKWHHTIIDAPGHRDFIQDMITGASQADVGMIMVPADGNFTIAIAKGNHEAGGIQGQARVDVRLQRPGRVDERVDLALGAPPARRSQIFAKTRAGKSRCPSTTSRTSRP